MERILEEDPIRLCGLFTVGALSGVFFGTYLVALNLAILAYKTFEWRFFFGSIYHVLYFMSVWCYWVSCRSNPGYVEYQEEIQGSFGTPTYCSKCNSSRPSNAHHCKTCRRCVLRMDHHCVFIHNCVGFKNHKCFILMLTYTAMHAFWGILMFVALIADGSVPPRDTATFSCVMLAVFAAATLCIFTGYLSYYQWSILLQNKTTLEDLTGGSNSSSLNSEEVDKWRDFKFIFGANKLLWFLPVWSSNNDGYS